MMVLPSGEREIVEGVVRSTIAIGCHNIVMDVMVHGMACGYRAIGYLKYSIISLKPVDIEVQYRSTWEATPLLLRRYGQNR